MSDTQDINANSGADRHQEDIEKFKAEVETLIGEEFKKFQTKFEGITSDSITTTKSAILELNATIESSKKSLSKEILSFTETQTNTIDTTLKNIEKNTEESEKNRNAKFDKIVSKIESLLPQASAVGISKAFADEKTAHKNSIFWYNFIFIIVIVFMIGMPFVSYKTGFIVNFFDTPGTEVDTTKFIISCVRLAAIELPLLWLANLMSKKMQQHVRIHEEYAHKYAAAMTFVGLSKEASEKTNIFGAEHIKNLTEGFRDAVYMNPSITLDKHQKTESPLEVLPSLVEKFGPEAIKSIIDNQKK